jgi:lipopolysaccharide/colanic/teichoic acid biosynthesis glycosyltransferase
VYTRIVKPFFDRFAAGLILLITAPILVVTVIMLAFANKGKVWFTQRRPGKGEKIFKIIKFKTMTDARNREGTLLSDAERLTPTGRFVRKTSLDELPQLINVLLGDMSIVGPRPLLEEYLPLYSNEQKRRHEVKPGITGWAQVNGRNAISWEEKFAFDVWYVNHVSFALDIKILFLTLVKVFKAEGITSSTSASMEKFSGSK